MATSEKKRVDKNPTQVKLEDGTWATPDKEGRFSIEYTGSEKNYLYDGKPVSTQDAFGALTGMESIPKRIRSFGGIGEGSLRKAYESQEDYDERMAINKGSL